jgi:hypothetical protein
MKEGFQSKGTSWAPEEVFVLDVGIHPINDKDSQSAKNKGELSERHLPVREVLN